MKTTNAHLYNMAVTELWLFAQSHHRTTTLEYCKKILLKYLPNADNVFQNNFYELADSLSNLAVDMRLLATCLNKYKRG